MEVARPKRDDAADDLLPPSAADDLLPPGAGEPTGGDMTPQPLPTMKQVPLPTMDQGAAEANAELKVQETGKKIVNKYGEEIELRRLSPEEKARRRRMKNIILVSTAAVIFAVALAIMLNI